MKLLKKIYTILVLINNVLNRRKHYKLTFTSEDTEVGKLWFYKFKHWGFNHMNLLMVDGADVLCEKYANGGSEVTIELMASEDDLYHGQDSKCYDHYVAEESSSNLSWYDKLTLGRDYTSKEGVHFWICPVTLFVLGRYPKHLYVKKCKS